MQIIHLLARLTIALWALLCWMGTKGMEKGHSFIKKIKDSFGSWKRKGKKPDPTSTALLGRSK
jgi:hypothetical protein